MIRFATRATLTPNLFQKFEKWLVMLTYRKVLGERVAAVAKFPNVSTYGKVWRKASTGAEIV